MGCGYGWKTKAGYGVKRHYGLLFGQTKPPIGLGICLVFSQISFLITQPELTVRLKDDLMGLSKKGRLHFCVIA